MTSPVTVKHARAVSHMVLVLQNLCQGWWSGRVRINVRNEITVLVRSTGPLTECHAGYLATVLEQMSYM